MKINMLAGPLFLITAFLIGSYTSHRAEAQSSAPATLDWIPYVGLVHVDDGTGNFVPTVQISGANLRIVNGAGRTQTANGAGNLIVGYNEFGNPFGDDRTGSHNISFGEANSFSSFGGLVGPNSNTISAAFSSVSGGQFNRASGNWASVSGGAGNTASGTHASVSGGGSGYVYQFGGVTYTYGNTASGKISSVAGGGSNWLSCSFSGCVR